MQSTPFFTDVMNFCSNDPGNIAILRTFLDSRQATKVARQFGVERILVLPILTYAVVFLLVLIQSQAWNIFLKNMLAKICKIVFDVFGNLKYEIKHE